MRLLETTVRQVYLSEAQRYQRLMQAHHYLGASPKISETLWYVATWRDHWVALATFSAAAWKCAARDRWIGWDYRHQYDRLKLLTNNSRFLILPDWHFPNLASRILSLCRKRIQEDWRKAFGHPVLLMETFVDPKRFTGAIYKASNWLYVGNTKGYRRIRQGYSKTKRSKKMVFLKPLQSNAQTILSRKVLKPPYITGGAKMKLEAGHMRSLYEIFIDIPDPRRAQGRRHSLPTVLSICAGAVLCGMCGYKGISDWAKSLSQTARKRFRCTNKDGKFIVPCEFTIRYVLINIEPDHLNAALIQWNNEYGVEDESLAIDGKTMCNAIADNGRQTHIMSAVGHESKICHTQKKLARCL